MGSPALKARHSSSVIAMRPRLLSSASSGLRFFLASFCPAASATGARIKLRAQACARSAQQAISAVAGGRPCAGRSAAKRVASRRAWAFAVARAAGSADCATKCGRVKTIRRRMRRASGREGIVSPYRGLSAKICTSRGGFHARQRSNRRKA